MVFGKIEYLNLLPFHIFMKRFVQYSSAKKTLEYKKNVPAKINREFHNKRVDAAFISSITAQKHKHINLGIVAKKEVQSVLVIPADSHIHDNESASSNQLAKILGIEGQVLIGDKALKYALHNKEYIDLAKEWHTRYRLPFVFALLCFHKNKHLYKRIEKNFLKKPYKIPQYILEKASNKTDINKKDILHYLSLISYHIDKKSQLGLKKFYKESQKKV